MTGAGFGHSAVLPADRAAEIGLVEAWLASHRSGPLEDSLGRSVEVIYAGRLSPGPGPDIVDAIFSFAGGPSVRGDVEVHLKPADWFSHGHHEDAAYRNVVLHVVGSLPAAGYSGPPCVAIRNPAKESVGRLLRDGRADGWPCAADLSPQGRDQALRTLAWQGWRRAVRKSEVIESDLAVMSADASLYLGLLDALGYSQNRAAFRRLGLLLPFASFRGLAGGDSTDSLQAEAVMFGSAGLLPSQRWGTVQDPGLADSRARHLERLWSSMGIPALEPGIWRFHGVRPSNWPTRRLAAAARLLSGPLAPSPAEQLLLTIVEEVDRGPPGRLERLFSIPVGRDHYWASHLDFGHEIGAPVPSLVGAARAREIVANVAIPHAICTARVRGDATMLASIQSVFLSLGVVGDNQITSYMATITRTADLRGIHRADVQQGLLDVYHRRCRDKLCGDCPLAAPETAFRLPGLAGDRPHPRAQVMR